MRVVPQEDGYRRAGPRLPTGLVVAAVVIALLAVSGLIYLLYQETRGPGEILRRFAQTVDDGDCAGSYELLDASVRAELDDERWCQEILPLVDRQIDADFDLEQAVLRGDQAEVQISGADVTVWRLRRFGDRSWRVLISPTGLPVATAA
jgi:hypothetical protein